MQLQASYDTPPDSSLGALNVQVPKPPQPALQPQPQPPMADASTSQRSSAKQNAVERVKAGNPDGGVTQLRGDVSKLEGVGVRGSPNPVLLRPE